MAARRMLLRLHEDGHLEMLEPVEIPRGTTITATLELPEKEAEQIKQVPVFAKWDLGAKEPLTREDIYEDLI